MDKKIVPVPGCADTIMRHGLKPGGEIFTKTRHNPFTEVEKQKNSQRS